MPVQFLLMVDNYYKKYHRDLSSMISIITQYYFFHQKKKKSILFPLQIMCTVTVLYQVYILTFFWWFFV